MNKAMCIGVAALTAALPSGQAHARQQGAPPPDHEHAPAAPPRTFGEGWLRVHDELAALEPAAADGGLVEISLRAGVIGELGARLGGMLLGKNPPFEGARGREIGAAVQKVVVAAIDAHEAADAGDTARARAGCAAVARAVAEADAVIPSSYYCPMHCEGTRTYGAPGECPDCGMALKKVTTAKYGVKVLYDEPVEPGAAWPFRFRVVDPTGAAGVPLDIVHEKPLHLLMVSDDLSWYAHEHPERQTDGTFALAIAFPHAGGYTLFSDFSPTGVGQQVVSRAVRVKGDAPAPAALTPDAGAPKQIDGLSATLDTGGPVVCGARTRLRYTLSAAGAPVKDLEPYLGAMGHLIIVSADRRTFVHSHPKEGGGHGPVVEFEATFERPGRYKSWAQFQRGGAVLTVPFVFDVGAAEKGNK